LIHDMDENENEDEDERMTNATRRLKSNCFGQGVEVAVEVGFI